MYEWYSNDYIKAMKERPLDEHEIYGLSTDFNLGKARRYAIEHNHIKYRDKFCLAFNLLFQSEYKTMEMLYAGGFPVTQSILTDAIDFRDAKAVEILLKYMKHPVTEKRRKKYVRPMHGSRPQQRFQCGSGRMGTCVGFENRWIGCRLGTQSGGTMRPSQPQ